MAQIKKDQFFANDVNWELLLTRELQPPQILSKIETI